AFVLLRRSPGRLLRGRLLGRGLLGRRLLRSALWFGRLLRSALWFGRLLRSALWFGRLLGRGLLAAGGLRGLLRRGLRRLAGRGRGSLRFRLARRVLSDPARGLFGRGPVEKPRA